jgi:hypothetical protein
MVSEQIAQIATICLFTSYGPAIMYADVPEHMIGKILGIDTNKFALILFLLPWICDLIPPRNMA